MNVEEMGFSNSNTKRIKAQWHPPDGTAAGIGVERTAVPAGDWRPGSSGDPKEGQRRTPQANETGAFPISGPEKRRRATKSGCGNWKRTPLPTQWRWKKSGRSAGKPGCAASRRYSGWRIFCRPSRTAGCGLSLPSGIWRAKAGRQWPLPSAITMNSIPASCTTGI